MGFVSIIIGFFLAVAIVASTLRIDNKSVRGAAAVVAIAFILAGIGFSSVRFVNENSVGVIIKNALGPSLPSGQIVATEGEMGPQAKILPPGWHFGYWPVIYDIELQPIVSIEQGNVGVITTFDGLPLPQDQFFAPEWAEEDVQQMLDAQHFLTAGGGFKGAQVTVLKPGKYRINPKLFKVEQRPVVNIPRAAVGVVKSNTGEGDGSGDKIVPRGSKGIWETPLSPGVHPLNEQAYEVTTVSTKENMLEFTDEEDGKNQDAIEVRTTDGFEFPVDVRVFYKIAPEDAPLVVASLGDDQDGLRQFLAGSLRGIFRNNAQDVKALNYVQQRSEQEVRSTEMLAEEMKAYGVTITAVRIADLGDDDNEEWQNLLETQTNREIALQEQETFQEQQRAAEQKKQLTRTQQEAEEERRLATATYEVKIAEENKQQAIIAAQAEAEAIAIRAAAQADAFRMIAQQIGAGNAALIELLKVVGQEGIEITPRVMVNGNAGTEADASTTALIGTMLDSMVRDQDEEAGNE